MSEVKNNADSFFRGDGDFTPPAPEGNTQPPAPEGNTQPPAPEGNTQPPAPEGNTQLPAPEGNTQPPAPEGNTQPPAPVKKDVPDNSELFKKYGFNTVDEFEAKLKEIQEAKPAKEFKSEFAKKFDAFATITGKEDLKTYQFYQNSIPEKPTTEDKISLVIDKMILDKPNLAHLRDGLINQKKVELGLDIPEGTELTDSDKIKFALAEANMDTEYGNIVNEIKDMNSKIEEASKGSAQSPEVNTQQIQENKEKWSKITSEMMKDFKIDVPDSRKKEDGTIEYLDNIIETINFDDRLKDRAAAYMNFALEANNWPSPSDDAVADAREFAIRGILREELPVILKTRDAMIRDAVIKEIELAGGNVTVWKQKKQAGTLTPQGGSNAAAFFGRG